MFDKYWFLKHQKILLKFANFWMGKKILCIKSNKQIIQILPNSITWKQRKQFVTEFRTHDKYAKRLYYAFKPFWYLLHYWDILFANTFKPSWNLGFDTLTAFPAAGANSPVDGYVGNDDAVYATCHDAATGVGVSATTADDNVAWHRLLVTYTIQRGIFLFDTSSLGLNTTISAAVFSIYGTGSTDTADNENAVCVSSSPAANDALTTADYDQLGTTSFGTVDIGSWSAVAYNDFTLNANGIANISKTSISKFGTRTSGDIANSAPTNNGNRAQGYFADQAGTANDPKLVVTYQRHGGFFAIL